MFQLHALAALTSAALFIVTTPSAPAADPGHSTRRTDQYYVAAGKTYNMHAHDHVRMLGKFAAASDKPVPREVVREHATAIADNVEHARQAYAKLAQTAAENPAVATQLAEINKRLAAVSKQITQMKDVSSDDALEAKIVSQETADIANNLKATHEASKAIDLALADDDKKVESREAFYNPDSPSYYFTGEGHFID